MLEVILISLIVLMLVGAMIAIETPNLLHSVISVGAVGFLLSIVFLFLSAPDLAITQIAVEVITLVLLLRAARDVPADERQSAPQGSTSISIRHLGALLVLIVLIIFSTQMFAEFPAFGVPVMDQHPDAPSNTYLAEGLQKTGATNIVTAVLLDYRAYDTLGEATVLFCAVTGALTILHGQSKRGAGKGQHVAGRDQRDAGQDAKEAES
jgi:multisubunit Na+/H+ antiporter MnhB subunit